MEPSPKLPTDRRALRKYLDRIHSQYIRLQAADSNGLAKCVTCDPDKAKLVPWGRLYCGHFVSRRHYVWRWDITLGNCAPQCAACNRFDQGRQYAFSRHINEHHGTDAAAYLWNHRHRPSPIEVGPAHELLRYMIKANAEKLAKLKTR